MTGKDQPKDGVSKKRLPVKTTTQAKQETDKEQMQGQKGKPLFCDPKDIFA